VINHLRIKNFKAWRDTGDIRLAPLTLLFGPNSAGKTSIPQLLLLLKQTAESTDRQRALHFGDHRTLVDLDDLPSVLHGHDLRRSLELELEWTLPRKLNITDAYHNAKHTVESLEFGAAIRGEGEPTQPFVQRMRYTLDPGSDDSVQIGMSRKKAGVYDLDTAGYQAVRRQGRKWPLPAPTHFFGFPDEAMAYFQNTGFVADLGLELTRLLEGIHYVGPLREYPRRLYPWSGETPIHVGAKGERAVEAILASKGRSFNLGGKQRYKPLDVLVAERLKQMGLISDFEVKAVAQGRKEYEVRARIGRQGAKVLLTDVGFGVSQVLPVVVECFYVPAQSIVIFEQPEIHLHAAVQAELADLFIDAICAREDGKDRNIQFIIESHSEHLLRRLQRRIAEGVLAPEDAALYFVDTTDEGARIEELAMDEYGRISNWPDNFFGDAIGETEAQMDAMFRKMQEKSGGR
jgi:predicted ATPase